MKTHTEAEVKKLLQITMIETAQGFMEWLKAETDIVDKNTRAVTSNTEIEIKTEKTGMMDKYIYPRLLKHGIIITDETI